MYYLSTFSKFQIIKFFSRPICNTGEPKIFEDEYFDLDENIKLWARANKFVNHLYASYGTQYYNMDSGKKSKSNYAYIL